MVDEEKIPVLIVGAGPTGLTMAIELAKRGVPCRILDGREGGDCETAEDGHAEVVHSHTLEVFERMGIAPQAFASGVRSRGVNLISQGETLGRLDLVEGVNRHDFEVVLARREIEETLRSHLASVGVEVEWGRELVDFTRDALSAHAVFRGPNGLMENIATDWLLGCDGGQSKTRRLLGESLIGVEPARWAALDCRLEGGGLAASEVTVFLAPEVFLFTPLPQDRWRVHLQPSSESSDPVEDLQRGLDAHGVDALVRDPTVVKRFPSGNGIASSWRHGHIFLAGSAAHVASPLEGTGMNTGVEDAYNLAWKLALVHAGVCRENLLESYEIERRTVAEAIADPAQAEVVRASLEVSSPRRRLVGNELDDFKRHRAESASEREAHYRDSPIVRGEFGTRRRHPAPGDRLPMTGFVIASDGGVVDLHTPCTQPAHTILCVIRGSVDEARGAGLRALQEVANSQTSLISSLVIVSDREASEPQWADCWYRAEGDKVFDSLGIDREALFVVRPDRFLGLRANSLDAQSIDSYFNDLRLGRVD